MAEFENQVFKQGSTTYYNSSLYFPKSVRDDVAKLYSFVRVVDDYVDTIPPDTESFKNIQSAFIKSGKLKNNNDVVLDNIYYIIKKYNIPQEEIVSFLRSMEMDTQNTKYLSLKDTLNYIYGSAEVIGLAMARILGLKKQAFEPAKMQGRAMQYINFIRDIDEDNKLGRLYFAKEILNSFNLNDLKEQTANKQPEEFKQFIQQEIKRYEKWQNEAVKGYRYIPYRQLIAVKTAADMYNWTAKQIYIDPFVVYRQKVKPTKNRIRLTALKNGFACLRYILR